MLAPGLALLDVEAVELAVALPATPSRRWSSPRASPCSPRLARLARLARLDLDVLGAVEAVEAGDVDVALLALLDAALDLDVLGAVEAVELADAVELAATVEAVHARR